MGKGYWKYIDGDLEMAPQVSEDFLAAAEVKAFKDWNQEARKVMHWLSLSITDSMLGNTRSGVPKGSMGQLGKAICGEYKSKKNSVENIVEYFAKRKYECK